MYVGSFRTSNCKISLMYFYLSSEIENYRHIARMVEVLLAVL
jgi:hypothetical protein